MSLLQWCNASYRKLRKEIREGKRIDAHIADIQSVAIGMNSAVDVEKDLHVLMLDYDGIEQERVIASVRELQIFWNLADAQLFKTKHGYHAIFFEDQMPFSRMQLIIQYARDVDLLFKYISRYYAHKTLRVAGKHQTKDIIYVGKISGVRKPTREEKALGAIKQREHIALRRA